jgi:hypothetical protein
MVTNMSFWASRTRAAAIHLAISLVFAASAGLLVFVVWYPYPYREISGGSELFLLVVAVDVVMGPLMTLAVFNLAKPRKELRRDLAVIAALQISALAYGLWTVAVARPVHLVFEIDRFRVVHAIDVEPVLLERAAPVFRQLPLTGPTLLSTREFRSSKESFDATMAALQGAAIGAQPDLWQNYEKASAQVIAAAKPLAELKTRFPARVQEIDAALKAPGSTAIGQASIGYIPLASRSTFWTVLINTKTADVVGFVSIDPY